MASKFERWIEELDRDVIHDGFGYEEGEFAVYPEAWRPYYRQGLTPREAFERALQAAGDARRKREAERLANWARIQTEDAKLRRPTPTDAQSGEIKIQAQESEPSGSQQPQGAQAGPARSAPVLSGEEGQVRDV